MQNGSVILTFANNFPAIFNIIIERGLRHEILHILPLIFKLLPSLPSYGHVIVPSVINLMFPSHAFGPAEIVWSSDRASSTRGVSPT